MSSIQFFFGFWNFVNIAKHLRGHVNKKKFQKSKKTLEVGEWVKCPIGNNKKLENIFVYIILLRFWASIRTSIML